MLKISKQSDISAFRALDLLQQVNQLKKEGADVISLAPGQPSDGAPRAAIEYGIEALQNGDMGYTEAIGMPILRQRRDDIDLGYVLSNSFGFGGTNAALVFKHPDA